jgi:hypothetical protein
MTSPSWSRALPRTDPAAQAWLRVSVAVVAAWVETFIDCEALEWFGVDANWDPANWMP